jgi:hypothetical protein
MIVLSLIDTCELRPCGVALVLLHMQEDRPSISPSLTSSWVCTRLTTQGSGASAFVWHP